MIDPDNKFPLPGDLDKAEISIKSRQRLYGLYKKLIEAAIENDNFSRISPEKLVWGCEQRILNAGAVLPVIEKLQQDNVLTTNEAEGYRDRLDSVLAEEAQLNSEHLNPMDTVRSAAVKFSEPPTGRDTPGVSNSRSNTPAGQRVSHSSHAGHRRSSSSAFSDLLRSSTSIRRNQKKKADTLKQMLDRQRVMDDGASEHLSNGVVIGQGATLQSTLYKMLYKPISGITYAQAIVANKYKKTAAVIRSPLALPRAAGAIPSLSNRALALKEGEFIVGRPIFIDKGIEGRGQSVTLKQLKPAVEGKKDVFRKSKQGGAGDFDDLTTVNLGETFLIMTPGWKEALSRMTEEELNHACKVIPPEDFARRRMPHVTGEIINVNGDGKGSAWVMLEITQAKLPRLIKLPPQKGGESPYQVGDSLTNHSFHSEKTGLAQANTPRRMK